MARYCIWSRLRDRRRRPEPDVPAAATSAVRLKISMTVIRSGRYETWRFGIEVTRMPTNASRKRRTGRAVSTWVIGRLRALGEAQPKITPSTGPPEPALAHAVLALAITLVLVMAAMNGADGLTRERGAGAVLIAIGITFWAVTMRKYARMTVPQALHARFRVVGAIALAAGTFLLVAGPGEAQPGESPKPVPTAVPANPPEREEMPAPWKPQLASVKAAGARWMWGPRQLTAVGETAHEGRRRVPAGTRISDVAPCGQRLLVVYESGVAATFSAATGRKLAEIKVSNEPGVAACADGSVFVSVPGARDGTEGAYVYRGSPSSLAPVAKIPVQGEVDEFIGTDEQLLRLRRRDQVSPVSIDLKTNTVLAARPPQEHESPFRKTPAA